MVCLTQASNPLLKGKTGAADKQPVLFVHGVGCSSLVFLVRAKNATPLNRADDSNQQVDLSAPNAQSAVTLLLDFGHEVWLLERRGATWSTCNRNNAAAKGKEYWNFSLDEQAQIDLPEVVEYILCESKRPKLSLVGHSLGATLILMALSSNSELQRKGE